MAEIRTLKLNLLADTKDFAKGLRGARGATKTFAGKLGDYTRTAALGFAALSAAVIGTSAIIGKQFVDAASNLNEAVTKSGVVFGSGAKEIRSFAQAAAKNLGLSERAAIDAASTFAVFGKSAGLTGKDLTGFSKKLTILASDFASFYNTSPEDAITAIGAALRGESEPIRRYGILLNDAALKQQALKMDLYDGTGALDAQSRVLAAYQVILQQSTDAQGDFTRTSDGLANQQRILSASFENTKASIGESLLPVALKLVSFINEKLIPTVQEIGRGFAGDDNNGLSNKVRSLARQMDDPSDAYSLGSSLRSVTTAFGALFTTVAGDGQKTAGTLETIATSLESIAGAIDNVRGAWNRAKSIGGGLLNFIQITEPEAARNRAALGLPPRAAGGPVTKGRSYLVGEYGPEVVTMGSNGSVSRGAGGTTIIMNGIIDAESARRSIERLLQQSSRRSGGVNFNGALS